MKNPPAPAPTVIHRPEPAAMPLGQLPEAGRVQAITELLAVASDVGLAVNARIRPEVWAKMLPEYSYDQLEAAVFALAKGKPGGWLNVPGDLLAFMADPDLAAWEAVERAATRPQGQRELAPLPEFTVRHLLAALDCGTLVFDLANAEHPIRRRELRDRFLAACKTPRPSLTAEVLASPALPYRERVLRAHAYQLLAERAPLLLSVDE